MEFLNKMNVTPGLMTYEDILKSQETSQEADKSTETGEQEEKKNLVQEPQSTITQFNLEELNEEKEETGTETKETDDKGKKAPESGTKGGKKYTSIVKTVAESLGYEFNEEEFEDSAENLVETIKDMILENGYKVYEEEKEQFLTPLQKRFVSMVEEGVDQDEALDFFKDVKKFESITEESIEDNKLAKDVYKAYLKKATAWTDKKIEKEIEEEETLGSLIDKAKESLPELQDIFKKEEKAKLDRIKEQETINAQNYQKQLQELNQFLDTTEEIAGIKLTPKMKSDWKKEYSTVNVNGKPSNPINETRGLNPTRFDALVKLYHSLGLFKYDKRTNDFRPDFNVIKNLNKKDLYKQVEDAVDAENHKRIATSGKTVEEMNFESEKETAMKKLIEIGRNFK